MVEVLLKPPEDLRWTLKSELKEEDVEELDHLIKEGLFKRIKEIE